VDIAAAERKRLGERIVRARHVPFLLGDLLDHPKHRPIRRLVRLLIRGGARFGLLCCSTIAARELFFPPVRPVQNRREVERGPRPCESEEPSRFGALSLRRSPCYYALELNARL